MGAGHEIVGATLNSNQTVVYMALGGAGEIGEYDELPLILTSDVQQQ